jgi:transposase InsO family protein
MNNQWTRFLDEVDYVGPLCVRHIQIAEVPPTLTAVNNWLPGYNSNDLEVNQAGDKDIAKIKSWLGGHTEPTKSELALSSPASRHLWQMRSQLRLHKNVLFYYWEEPLSGRYLLLVPQNMRNEILHFCHDSQSAGHVGRDNTYFVVKQSFYWHRMYQDVENFVASCAACSKNKKPNRRKRAPLESYQAGAPMERVHVDILGPFTKSKRGNTCVLMVVDQFTKWLESYPMPDQTAERVADKLICEYFSRFGYPNTIHTHQGSNFTGHVFKSMCQMLQINKTRTTPYRPQSNGQVERYNRTLVEMIRCLNAGTITDWDLYLPHVTSAIRE